MGRNPEPVALLEWKGRNHRSKREMAERKAREIAVPFTDVKPPDFLTGAKAREEFEQYAEKLQAIGILTELDADCLGQYILSKALYINYTALVTKMIKKGDLDELPKIQNLQDKAFKQCHTCASALGLTITSRCKLAIPERAKDDDLTL